ncbi:uncharacterized protein LOC135370345 isoform X2 [Ornithodoros turicata]|uniref:uncharacterized protein LOC135370345 isoform X2 n=1 Tax=Ornithodoros turicata TaxID=34597 RepID=UPI0031396D30
MGSSDEKLFAVVKFPDEEDCVAIVHVNWLNGGVCMWPPEKNGNKLRALIEEGTMPAENWFRQRCRPLGLFSTYEQARQKLAVAEVRSDLSTDQELGRGKRRRIVRSFSSSDEDDISLLPKPPTPPPCVKLSSHKKPISSHKKPGSSRSSKDLPQTHQRAFCPPYSDDEDIADEPEEAMCHSSQRSSAAPSLSSSQSSLPTSARGSCVMASDDYEAGYMHNHRISPAVKGSTAFSQDTKSGSNALPGSAENAAFQKRVLTLLHSIRYEVQDISSQLSHSLSKLSIHKDVDEHEKLFEEPINNLDDFVEFDNQLRNNKQKQTEVRTFLAMFGGRGTADHVARILSRVITNDLATEFSWFGARGKDRSKTLHSQTYFVSPSDLHCQRTSRTQRSRILKMQ